MRIATLAMALGSAFLVTGVGPPASASHQTVTAVRGSAFGYNAFNISLFGGGQPPTGPAPTVTLASDASNSPATASAPSGLVQYGPAVLFTSDQISVGTSGSLGDAGSATSTATVENVNRSTTQPSLTGSEILGADTVASTCTATTSGTSGSTTITAGSLRTDSGLDLNADGDFTDAGEHAPVFVDISGSPAAGATYTGHIHLSPTSTDYFTVILNEQVTNPDGSLTVNAVHEVYGTDPPGNTSNLKGDLIIGQSVCGVTIIAAPHPADVAVGDISHVPGTAAPQETVTYTIPVTNNGPEDASGVRLLSTVSGTRGATLTSGTTAGGTCVLLKGRTKGLSCDLGTIANGATELVTVTLTAPRKTGTITLTSTVSSDDDPNAANNTASEDTVVV